MLTKTRLDDKNRSERCIFLCADSPTLSEIPAVLLGRADISISGPAIRAWAGATSIHKNSENSNGSIAQVRHEIDDFFGRSDSVESKQGQVGDRNAHSNMALSLPGVHSEHEEIGTYPHKNNRIPGFCNLFSPNDFGITGRQGKQNSTEMPIDAIRKDYHGKATVKIVRDIDSDSVSNTTRTITLQTVADACTGRVATQQPIIRDSNDSDTRMQTRHNVCGG